MSFMRSSTTSIFHYMQHIKDNVVRHSKGTGLGKCVHRKKSIHSMASFRIIRSIGTSIRREYSLMGILLYLRIRLICNEQSNMFD